MSIDEILEAGKKGEITIYQAYDLCNEKLSENLKKSKTWEDSKKVQPENDILCDFMAYIEKGAFNHFASDIIAENFIRSDGKNNLDASDFFDTVINDIFKLQRAKDENQERLKEGLKESAKKNISATIELLEQLKEALK